MREERGERRGIEDRGAMREESRREREEVAESGEWEWSRRRAVCVGVSLQFTIQFVP